MGFALADRFPDFHEIYERKLKEAGSALGFELSKLMKEGPAEELKKTEFTQPALLTLSSAMGEWLDSEGIKGQLALGHSLGEYSALVYAGSLEFKTAVKLVHTRGQLMNEAVPEGIGGMAALVGAGMDDAKKLCKETSSDKALIEPSVHNSAGQIVISGHKEALDQAAEKASNFGVRKVVPLEVSGPFHCSLLKEAGEKLRRELQKANIKAPRIPVIFNATAAIAIEPDQIIENLVEQVSSTVLWADSIRQAGDEQVTEFVEIGSGKVLTGLIKKILPDAKCTPLDSIQKLELLAA